MKKLGSIFSAWILVMAVAWLAAEPVAAQVTTPVVSPYATVSEQLGLTDITIKYCRPGVKGRKIWGGVVPDGLASPFPGFGSGNPFPWRAGANENTTISFEHDVLIEGEKLHAGTYGLHMIPGEDEWVVVFSRNSTSWGSFFYDEAEDALRVTVAPEKGSFQERLVYEFMDQDDAGSATIALLWEEVKVPFKVAVDNYHEVVLASMRDELRSRGGFSWQGYAQAANFALQNNTNHEEALQWAETAIAQNKAFNTLSIKAGLLAQMGNIDEGIAVMDEAVPMATENQLNAYGYQLMAQNQMDKALEIFTLNVERHPDSWNPHDSLAECYANMGDTENARKYYQMALDKLPEGDTANKDRIEGVLADLK
ncbi:MAG: DUF2911 domain-containing protein [Rhodothermales bacterium]